MGVFRKRNESMLDAFEDCSNGTGNRVGFIIGGDAVAFIKKPDEMVLICVSDPTLTQSLAIKMLTQALDLATNHWNEEHDGTPKNSTTPPPQVQ